MRSRVLGLAAITLLTLGLTGIVGTAQTQSAAAARPTTTAKPKCAAHAMG